MPRFARVVIPDQPHHVTQRGNNRQAVFFVEDDYRVYLEILAEQAEKFSLSIDGYCLMPNHVHLIVTPQGQDSLAKGVGRTHFRYTQYVNRFHRRSGHLWQNRFFSCLLDESHCQRAMAYVEQNPVKARLAKKPWLWAYSSAKAHVNPPADMPVPLTDWPIAPAAWKEILDASCDDEFSHLISRRTQTGRPLANDSFVSKIEHLVGRRLRPLPVGRPKKKKNNPRNQKK